MNAKQFLIGVEIGGTKLQVVLGDERAAILDRRRFEVSRAAGAEGIRQQIAQAAAEFLSGRRIAAAGIGFGGPVEWKTGRIACSHHIEGWADFELARWMQDLVQAPVRVDNDANTAALAEAVLGAGRQSNPVFYVTLGSGVGGGLAVNQEIYHGAPPGEAEIGHLRLDLSGTIVEQRCAGWSVDRRIREAAREHPDSLLAKLAAANPGAEARHLPAAISAGDGLAGRILDETAQALAFALSHVTHLFHPEMIVLGGGLARLDELLRAAVERHLRRLVMDAFLPGPAVRLAALGEDAVPAGALLLARSCG